MEEDLKEKMNLMEIKHQREEKIHNKDFNERLSQVGQKDFLFTKLFNSHKSKPKSVIDNTLIIIIVLTLLKFLYFVILGK